MELLYLMRRLRKVLDWVAEEGLALSVVLTFIFPTEETRGQLGGTCQPDMR